MNQPGEMAMPKLNDGFTGPWGHDYGPVVQVLRRFHDERILFVPNYGNAGDSLITLGAMSMLDQLGIDYETGTHRSACKDRVVVYSGGGNLVRPYPNLRDFIDKNEPEAAVFVILPHTVRAWPKTLAAMGAHSIVFARETTSLAYLETHLTQAQAEISHDMAFMLIRRSSVRKASRPPSI